jgi:hypothetical protein
VTVSAKAFTAKDCRMTGLPEGTSLFDSCKEVTLKPDNRYEADLLAILVRITTRGGRITLEGMDRTTQITYGEWAETFGHRAGSAVAS